MAKQTDKSQEICEDLELIKIFCEWIPIAVYLNSA